MTLYKGTIPIAGLIDETDLVHLDGAETITGNKTFTGSVSLGTNTTGVTQASGDNSTKIATTAWVKSNGGGCPPGTICAFGGSSAPSGWLVCNGGAISRTTYADLFSVIETTYGSGDGSTTFNLPNRKLVFGSSASVKKSSSTNPITITVASSGGAVSGNQDLSVRGSSYMYINNSNVPVNMNPNGTLYTDLSGINITSIIKY